jgi:hypothetical protein
MMLDIVCPSRYTVMPHLIGSVASAVRFSDLEGYSSMRSTH